MQARSLPHLLIAAALACGGCEVVPGVTAAFGPRLSEVDGATPAGLDRDAWAPNQSWSPYDEWLRRDGQFPDPAHLRWTFQSLDATDTTLLPLPADRGVQRLTWNWGHDLSAWNAAVLLARSDPVPGAEILPLLERLVANPPEYRTSGKESRPISPAMRAAAAEAWCIALAAEQPDREPLDALSPAGRLLERTDLPLEVRAELLRGIARRVPPASIPRLAAALDDRARPAAVEECRAAIDACVIHALWNPGRFDESAWPEPLADWIAGGYGTRHSDPYVRSAFGRWLAVTANPAALGVLRDQLHDQDPSVRDDALISLGLLGTDEARAELAQQARRPEERVRAMAVRGLAHWGVGAMQPFAQDAAGLVRQAVAEELWRWPSLEAALMLRGLQADRDPQVQAAAVQTVRGWPDEFALTLLVQALYDGTARTRNACLEELQQRTGKTLAIPATGTDQEQSAAIDQVASQLGISLTYIDEVQRRGLVDERGSDPLEIAEIRMLLRDVAGGEHSPGSEVHQQALARLRGLRPEHVPAVEQCLLETSANFVAPLFDEILPSLSPGYAALRDLKNTDVVVRRAAAQRLAEWGASRSLSPLLVRHLAERMLYEQDALVWRSILAAVQNDGTPETARLAELAAQHAFPDIRRLACEYAIRHRRPEDARWLLPLLHDPDQSVQLAAIQAAAACHGRLLIDGTREGNGAADLPGLRPLMNAADPQVRIAAVLAMSRLGDSSALDELIRLSFDPDSGRRELAAGAMGPTGQTRFVDHLIRIGWTEPHDGVKQRILESLDQLVLPENRPAGLATGSGPDAKIRAWAEWHQAREARRRSND